MRLLFVLLAVVVCALVNTGNFGNIDTARRWQGARWMRLGEPEATAEDARVGFGLPGRNGLRAWYGMGQSLLMAPIDALVDASVQPVLGRLALDPIRRKQIGQRTVAFLMQSLLTACVLILACSLLRGFDFSLAADRWYTQGVLWNRAVNQAVTGHQDPERFRGIPEEWRTFSYFPFQLRLHFPRLPGLAIGLAGAAALAACADFRLPAAGAQNMKPALRVALLATALAFGWQCLTVHFNYGGNWTALFCTGSSIAPPPLPEFQGTYIFQGSRGYDGQFYRYLAHDPFFSRGFDHSMDGPRLRSTRILLPLVVYAAALGRPGAIDTAYYAAMLAFLFLGV
jgi:hypothetical protein